MKIIGVCVALVMLVAIASAEPAPAPRRRPNPCGGNPCGGKPMPPPMPPRRAEADPAKTYAIRIDPDDAIDGPTDAKITIVDTYDYACPYCDKVRPTLVALKEKYGKDLRFVYKQYVVHMSTAMAGALAACAANRQLGFASVDAALWDGYKNGKLDKDVANTPCWTLKEGCPVADAAATAAHLDLPKFKADMTSCKTAVARSMADMQGFGVYAIPTFFINGRVLTGAQPQASFEAIIDEEIKKADAKIKAGTKPAKYYQQWVVDHGEKAFAPKPANPCGGGMPQRPMNPCGGGM
jgi:protein-disulfide isomerase